MENQQITHDNHYVPKGYLKNWSKDGNTIFEYRYVVPEYEKKYWKPRPIKSTAVWTDFYTHVENGQDEDEIEQSINKEIETEGLRSIKRILDNDAIRDEDQIPISRYALFQFIRTPARMVYQSEWAQKNIPDLLQSVLNKASKEISKVKNNDIQIHKDSGTKYVPMTVNIDYEHSTIETGMLTGKGLYLFLLNHFCENPTALDYCKWSIIHSHESVSLPTSDNPVVSIVFKSKDNYQLSYSLLQPDSVIILPISPTTLLITQGSDQIKAESLNYSKYWSSMFRRIIIENSFRYVYALEPQRNMLEIKGRITNTNRFNAEKEIRESWHKEYYQALDEFTRKHCSQSNDFIK